MSHLKPLTTFLCIIILTVLSVFNPAFIVVPFVVLGLIVLLLSIYQEIYDFFNKEEIK